MTKKSRITARKYQGDDFFSWAVFLDGRPIITGLARTEVAYWKARIAKDLEEMKK